MHTRAIVIALLILSGVPEVHADRLQAAAKGKKQTVQPRYGEISSFDGKTIVFEESSTFGGLQGVTPTTLRDQILRPVQPVPTEYHVMDNEIIIALGDRASQDPVDVFHPESSVPGKQPKDLELQQAQIQRAEAEKKKREAKERPVEIDLTRCSGRGVDQVVEKDPQSNGATKPPVRGELQSIASGIATLKRSDGSVMKYRIDELAEIRIGMCE